MRRTRILAIAPALLAAVVYAKALQNGFAYDDVAVIQNNPALHDLSRISQILLLPWWPDEGQLYRPLTSLSLAVDWALSGGSAAYLHGVNVVLHAVATMLVMNLAIRLGARPVAAAAGAALFAVHPVHVEAVANLVGRAEVLATIGFVLAARLHLARSVSRPMRIGGVALCYLCALAAKESAVTLPAILLFLSYAEHARQGAAPRAAAVLALRHTGPALGATAAVLGAYLALRAHVLGPGLGTAPAAFLQGLSHADRTATAVSVWPEYLRLLVWPRDLAAEWGPATLNATTWADPRVYVGLVLVSAISGLAITLWSRGSRWPGLALGWFAITLLPISNLLFPIGVLLAERLLYLPSVAVVFLAPAADDVLRSLHSRVSPWAVSAGLLVLLALGGVHSWNRTGVWKSTDTVFASMVRDHPESVRVIWLGGDLMRAAGRYPEAVVLYQRAGELTTWSAPRLKLDLAEAYLRTGRLAEAQQLIREVLPAAGHIPRVWEVWSESLLLEGRYPPALAVMDAGARRAQRSWKANDPQLLGLRALAHDGLGRRDVALALRRASLRTEAGRASYGGWMHLARLHAEAGAPDSAAAALDSARARAPAVVRPRLTAPLPLRSPHVMTFGPPDPALPVGYDARPAPR